MRVFVIALVAIFALMAAPPASAGWFGGDDQEQEQSADQSQGQSQDQGQSMSQGQGQGQGQVAVGTGGDADVDSHIGNGFGNFSPDADARSTSGVHFSDDDVDITIVDANPSEGLKELGKEQRRAAERHAESAARSEAASMPNMTPCGDTTGMSAQTGLAGASMATIPEVCRAYRLQLLRNSEEERSFSTTLATITHYVGWFPRTLLHIGTLGVLN